VVENLALALRLPSTRGALVAHVEHESPAQRAGFEPGDVVTSFSSHQIYSIDELVKAVSRANSGEGFESLIIRDGEYQLLAGIVGARSPATESAPAE
jgi:S1-C subfamily serine protease